MGLQRLLHIAVNDTLQLDNGVSGVRALGYPVQVALHAIEVGALEDRVETLKEAISRDCHIERSRTSKRGQNRLAES